MRFIYVLLTYCTLFISCKNEVKESFTKPVEVLKPFTSVTIDLLDQDSTSIRAIEINNNAIMYAGSNGHYGVFKLGTKAIDSINNENPSIIVEKNKGVVDFLGKQPSFRSVASTKNAFFLLSIENPAVLYKYDLQSHSMKLVYSESNEKVFYDAMTFWNDKEGIAIGDPTETCLSIIITRDGGDTWSKLSCNQLPVIVEGEAAFAASNTNIKTIDDHTWVVSGGGASRVYYSKNKGESWEVYETPLMQGTSTQGAYTMDFYDKNNGIIYGGDYTVPKNNFSNIATTKDGGKTWVLVGSGANDGYKSCVQYVPNSNGMSLVALGNTGISYSSDAGSSWNKMSDESFLSFRFENDSIAYASGENKIARLNFN